MTNNEKLKHSNLLLQALVGKDLSDKWWHGPNNAFGGLTPAAQWLLNPDVVYSYLLSHAYGGEYG